MWRTLTTFAASMAVVACTQIPPSQKEIADKKMEPVAGKAVVYIVQNAIGTYQAGLLLDGKDRIVTWPDTYYRWETSPGAHSIRSSEPNLSARIQLQLEAGKVYFVEHRVTGLRGSTTDANLQVIGEGLGRRMVAAGRACCE